MESQNNKAFGLKRVKASITNSLNGLKETYATEQSVYIHLIATIFLVLLGMFFKISAVEWIIVVFISGLILTIELVNTAIENVVDLITKEYHPLAKIAKDTGSAAEFIIVIVSVISGLIIFLPKIIGLF